MLRRNGALDDSRVRLEILLDRSLLYESRTRSFWQSVIVWAVRSHQLPRPR